MAVDAQLHQRAWAVFVCRVRRSCLLRLISLRRVSRLQGLLSFGSLDKTHSALRAGNRIIGVQGAAVGAKLHRGSPTSLWSRNTALPAWSIGTLLLAKVSDGPLLPPGHGKKAPQNLPPLLDDQ